MRNLINGVERTDGTRRSEKIKRNIPKNMVKSVEILSDFIRYPKLKPISISTDEARKIENRNKGSLVIEIPSQKTPTKRRTRTCIATKNKLIR